MTDNETPIMRYAPAPTAYRQIASVVWSLDGTTLFVVRMDAVIVRMRVFPERLRSMDVRWSAPDTFNSVEKPYSAQQLSPSVPVCVAMPQRPQLENQTAIAKQARFLSFFSVFAWCSVVEEQEMTFPASTIFASSAFLSELWPRSWFVYLSVCLLENQCPSVCPTFWREKLAGKSR